jgi:hypothetical protein
MHPKTVATLGQLEKADWFHAVGIRDTGSAIILSSWAEAIESCCSLEWENLCLEAANQYRERIVERSKERFRQWNQVVDGVKPATEALVMRKLERVVHENTLPKGFEDTVKWDVLHLCMECEYDDVYPAGFYASQAFWYVKGHFPCGWQGNFPDGKLVIY